MEINQIVLMISVLCCLLLTIYVYKLRRQLSATSHVHHEKEIMLHNQQLETIVNTISDMAILSIADKEGNFLYYSNAANNYFAKDTFKSKAGSTYKKGVYFNADGSEIALYDMPVFRVLRGEKLINYDFVMKDLKGEINFLFNGSPVYSKDGNLVYGVFFNMDITQQLKHRKLVAVTEQLTALNALKDRLFTVFTHDIRNPMASMVSLIELLEEEAENYCSDSREIISAVKEQIYHTFHIVERLLEWLQSQKEGMIYNPIVCDLSKVVSEMITMNQIGASAKNIQISNDIIEGMSVIADKEMLESILRNILSNAIKFTGNGGIITIDAQETGNKTIISIKDNGKGIDHKKVKTLFNEDYATSTLGTAGEKGIGLGLLICKEFVTQNGGEIWVESTSERGTTICFSLITAD